MRKLSTVLCFMFLLFNVSVYGATTKIPILMYHDITAQTQSDNPWIVPNKSFFSDMIYLKQNYYTTLLPKDVIAIKNGQAAMPNKPIMITFDDGYVSNYKYALPILEALDMKATTAVITGLIRTAPNEGNPNYLTWAQANAMYQSRRFDIGSHMNILHNSHNNWDFMSGGINGISRLPNENKQDYENRTGQDLITSIDLIKTHTGSAPCYLAYPYGKTDPWMLDMLNANNINMTTTVKPDIADITNGLEALPRLTVTPQESASFVLSCVNTKSVLQATPITKKFCIDDNAITMPAFLIADNAYIDLEELRNICINTPYNFCVTKDAENDGLRISPTGDQTENINILPLTYEPKTIDTPPVLVAIGSDHTEAFLIEGKYFIRFWDINKLLLNNNN